MGQGQRKSLPGSSERMIWAAIDFESAKERAKFGDVFGQLKTLLLRQNSLYHMDLSNLR